MGDSSSRGLRKGTLFAGEFEIPYATTEVRLRPEAADVRLKADTTDVRLKADTTDLRLKADTTDVRLTRDTTEPPVLICVNGMQQTMAMWRSVLKRMAGTGYRTVLFDFPNQGRAAELNRHVTSSLSVPQQVEILAAVADHVSPRQPVALLGGSWGALIAAAYAAAHPGRVSRLVLGSFQTRPNEKLRQVARDGRALVEAGRGAELGELFVAEFGAGMDAVRQNAIEAQLRTLGPEQYRQMYDQAKLLVDDFDFESMVDLQRIDARTLIVNGEADPIVDCTKTPRTAARFRSASFEIVPAGHFLHFERPEIVDTYATFLTS
jgi:pimeloyl-ACP methyl ester carboxylesterase